MDRTGLLEQGLGVQGFWRHHFTRFIPPTHVTSRSSPNLTKNTQSLWSKWLKSLTWMAWTMALRSCSPLSGKVVSTSSPVSVQPSALRHHLGQWQQSSFRQLVTLLFQSSFRQLVVLLFQSRSRQLVTLLFQSSFRQLVVLLFMPATERLAAPLVRWTRSTQKNRFT